MSTLDFLGYVRLEPCSAHGTPAEPHHLITVGMGSNRKREMIEHLSAIPLCRICHMEVHTVGIEIFEDRHGINLWRENARLLARWIWERG